MRWTGVSPDRVARTTLDAHDHGRLYVVPQPDARLIWAAKRHLPRTYTAGLGLLNRALPALDRLSAPHRTPTDPNGSVTMSIVLEDVRTRETVA